MSTPNGVFMILFLRGETMYIYQRIRDLREDSDLTQKDVADHFGLHLTTYQRWESGQREMPTHMIIKLCYFYNVSADYLLGITNEKKPLPKKKL